MAEYLTEREEARERLKNSVDALTQQASLQVNLQKDPLKMLGGASAVGAVIGMVVGRQFRRSRKIYVDAASPAKHQKALIKAQKSGKGGVGGALVATLGTLAVKTVMDRVVTPRLEQLADNLLEKSGQPAGATRAAPQPTHTPAARPQATGGTVSFIKTPATPAQSYAQQAPAEGSVPPAPAPAHPGMKPAPASHVEAKAVGSPIAPDEMGNPNRR
ncbi:hypothetical protein CBQ26_04365 [Deinococcus indicus]|uniref:Uncharacterized protein n=1 Tax=Deinococcus indicus TaxID=223556 RepID=A0A246BPD8_9DEIO|nr:hypothetical protein [Deinococcus indicus]OWL97523.1 hypothetical protein CBQ26_04365 [Deinococcus indicus]GHG29630.1 hypothetical protein GCM10017784_23200 [Deinococcus indicus]